MPQDIGKITLISTKNHTSLALMLVNIVDYGIRSTRLDSKYSKNVDKIKALLGEE